jgi:hypothetical protein
VVDRKCQDFGVEKHGGRTVGPYMTIAGACTAMDLQHGKVFYQYQDILAV